jgi:hypothetical protein
MEHGFQSGTQGGIEQTRRELEIILEPRDALGDLALWPLLLDLEGILEELRARLNSFTKMLLALEKLGISSSCVQERLRRATSYPLGLHD